MNNTVQQRRELVVKDHSKLSVTRQCDLLNIHRSGLYYRNVSPGDEDQKLMVEIDKLHIMDPTMGTRRMSHELKAKGYQVGRQRVRRLMSMMRIKTVFCHPKTTISDPTSYKFPYLLRNLKINRVNQVWAIDISYIPMKKGFMYLVAIIDLYSRYIVGWSISNSMEAQWVVATLKEAIANHGKPQIINSDQGSQFTSEPYIGYIKSLETVKISMDGKGRATDNAYIERFFRTIKYEKLYLEPATNGTQLYKQCEQFINYYNNRRLHSAICYKPPVTVYRNAA